MSKDTGEVDDRGAILSRRTFLIEAALANAGLAAACSNKAAPEKPPVKEESDASAPRVCLNVAPTEDITRIKKSGPDLPKTPDSPPPSGASGTDTDNDPKKKKKTPGTDTPKPKPMPCLSVPKPKPQPK